MNQPVVTSNRIPVQHASMQRHGVKVAQPNSASVGVLLTGSMGRKPEKTHVFDGLEPPDFIEQKTLACS